MNHKKQNQHMVDTLFVLILFAFFAVCSFMLIMLGSGIYQNTIDRMNSNYSSRTSFAYISEKLRQQDSENSIHIDTFGDSSALVITEQIDDVSYQTWLYTDEGYIKELFCKKDASLTPTAGQKIMSCESFDIVKVENNLYHITVTTDTEDTYSCYINAKSSYYED